MSRTYTLAEYLDCAYLMYWTPLEAPKGSVSIPIKHSCNCCNGVQLITPAALLYAPNGRPGLCPNKCYASVIKSKLSGTHRADSMAPAEYPRRLKRIKSKYRPLEPYRGMLHAILHECTWCHRADLLALPVVLLDPGKGTITCDCEGLRQFDDLKAIFDEYASPGLKLNEKRRPISSKEELSVVCRNCGSEYSWSSRRMRTVAGKGRKINCVYCVKQEQQGKVTNRRDSRPANELLGALQDHLKSEIIFSKSERYVYCHELERGFYLDGYCPEHDLAIEFHGSVFHGDPRVVASDHPHPFRPHLLAQDLYAATLAKSNSIRNQAYSYFEMWELDYWKLYSSTSTWKEFFNSCFSLKQAKALCGLNGQPIFIGDRNVDIRQVNLNLEQAGQGHKVSWRSGNTRYILWGGLEYQVDILEKRSTLTCMSWTNPHTRKAERYLVKNSVLASMIA